MNQLNDDYQRAKAEIKKLKEANEALPNSGEMNDLIENTPVIAPKCCYVSRHWSWKTQIRKPSSVFNSQ